MYCTVYCTVYYTVYCTVYSTVYCTVYCTAVLWTVGISLFQKKIGWKVPSSVTEFGHKVSLSFVGIAFIMRQSSTLPPVLRRFLT